MTDLRFSHLSAPRQAIIRACQRIGFGKISGVVVCEGEPRLEAVARLVFDLKLEKEDIPRPEAELRDFALSSEMCRLFRVLDLVRNGIIEELEVRAGVPRRMVFQVAVDGHHRLTHTVTGLGDSFR